MAQNKLPNDLEIMAKILEEFGVQDYDENVLKQMHEFTYRYVTTVIEDALLYSKHANRKAVDVKDVKLAITLAQFASPIPRLVTAQLAHQRNSTPLPTIRSSNPGLHIPADRHSLTSANYHLVSPPKKARTNPRSNLFNVSTQKGIKQEPSSNTLNLPSAVQADEQARSESRKRPREDDDYKIV